MRAFITATLLAILGAATPASAITEGDLYDLGTCTYAVETGRPRMDARILTVCPTNVWYTCQGGTHICCDVEREDGTATVTLKLQ